jgi:hypothetical protein
MEDKITFVKKEVMSTLGRLIPINFYYEVEDEEKFSAVIESIEPVIGLEENEAIEELVIPETLKSEEPETYGQTLKVRRLEHNVFNQISFQYDFDKLIASKDHPIKRLVIEAGIEDIYKSFERIYVDTLVWPESCTLIRNCTFQNAQIKHFEGMAGVKSIEGMAFSGNNALEYFEWPKNCDYIPVDCFSGCQRLKTVSGIEGVTDIGDEAFISCRSMEEFNWPKGCEKIPADCFLGAYSLKKLNFSGPISKISPNALMGTSIKELDLSESIICDIPSSLTKIGIKVKLPFYA